MNLIKLDAIDSTNDFLKNLASHQALENFTTVMTENQTNGKGQMGAKWVSEPSKNLICSIFLKDFLNDSNQIFNLNRAVSVSVFLALEKYNLPQLAIKWPNDIMSDSKKIGGILIENTIKSDGKINSVIGIGLNVNQLNFELLPKASSMAKIMAKEFDKEFVLKEIISHLKTIVLENNSANLHLTYVQKLFKKGTPMPFETKKGKFMGSIQNVNEMGLLEVLLEDDSIELFDLKEIQMLY